MVALNSSNLTSADYADETRVMTIEFVSGSAYEYDGVPREIFEALVASTSPGAFFARQIRDVFPTRRIS